MTREAFDALANRAKQHAFTISVLHKANLVAKMQEVIDKAIAEGTGYQDVRRHLLALFDTEGLPGISKARLLTTFRNNTQQAYNDARREALDEASGAFPYRQYLTVGNGTPGYRNVRASHAILHGKVFAWNDPFWNAHTPPWEHGCRCTFRGLTAGQVKRMGVRVVNLKAVRKAGIGPSKTFSREPATENYLKTLPPALRDAVRELLKGK